MAENLRLMCVLAHPDDESLGTGGTLARYAAEGVETYLVTATRGERGWNGTESEYPGETELGRLREAELRSAAEVLGLREVQFLDYIDGDLDQANPQEAISRIVTHLRRVKPHVVISFGPDGAYGHPDHIAICQLTGSALIRAADGGYSDAGGHPPYAVPKLYYKVWTKEEGEIYQSAFGKITMDVDGEIRTQVAWEDWAITTRIDASAHWETVWKAVACHRTQLPNYSKLEALTRDQHRVLWGLQGFCRVTSLVNGGRKLETDLFEGLR
jgi:LmbE family N-acetylglucosaminyl deacetylase